MSNFSLSIRLWFRQNGRFLPWRETKDPYLIWLSEIILQQTRVDQGLPYYNRFSQNYPDIVSLANAEEQEILNLWQGLGYYSRARNLHQTAKFISSELNGRFPASYKEIIKLKGIGPYTAAAISSFAFNEKQAVVDGNVYRVLSRIFDISTPINSSQGKKEFQLIANELITDDEPGTHNQALMELGATVCKPLNPKCNECPVSDMCLASSRNTVGIRPVKDKKVKIRERHFNYLIFEENNKTILEQRNGKDIWEKLYQFPLIEQIDDSKNEVPTGYIRKSEKIQHVLSHQKIYATFYHYKKMPDSKADSWITIDITNLDSYPLPRLIDKYLQSLTAEN